MDAHNFILLKPGAFKQEVMYVDTSDYLADQCFIDYEVTVKYRKSEFQKPGTKYRVITASFKKTDIDKVKAAMEKLWSNMLVCGNTDYRNFCEEHFWKLFNN